MERYILEIRVDRNYVAVDADGRMPFMLADKIKAVVTDFYKEDK